MPNAKSNHRLDGHADALPYIEAALKKHGTSILDKGDLDLLCDGLCIASDDEFFLVSSARYEKLQHERDIKKSHILKELIAIYEEDSSDSIRTATGTFRSYSELALHQKYGIPLSQLMADLKKLAEIESAFASMVPDKIPNQRPVSAKNAGAECMFRTLRENKIDLWEACSIIACALVLAGIETGSDEKVKRALYDKLKRIE